MSSYNSVTLLGNIVRMPELRYGPSGKPVCGFSIALNKRWKGEDGSDKEAVVFVDCVAFQKTAETVAAHFQAGSPILLDGSISSSEWVDKQSGQKRSKLQVTVDRVTFLPRNSGNKSQDAAPRKPAVADMKQGAPSPTAEDDIPMENTPPGYDKELGF